MKPESRLQRRIRKLLEDEGGFVFKIHGGPFQKAGLPDLFMILEGQTYGIEIKCPGNTPSNIQLVVLTEMRKAGAVVMVSDDPSEVLDVVRKARSLTARGREIYAQEFWDGFIRRTGYRKDLDNNGGYRGNRKR